MFGATQFDNGHIEINLVSSPGHATASRKCLTAPPLHPPPPHTPPRLLTTWRGGRPAVEQSVSALDGTRRTAFTQNTTHTHTCSHDRTHKDTNAKTQTQTQTQTKTSLTPPPTRVPMPQRRMWALAAPQRQPPSGTSVGHLLDFVFWGHHLGGECLEIDRLVRAERAAVREQVPPGQRERAGGGQD